MVVFLISMDSKTWKAIMKGWQHPGIIDKDGNTTFTSKPEKDWPKDEDELALENSKASNALFNGVEKNMFRLINTCIVAKDVGEIPKTTHESTAKVRMSRLQLLTTKYENLRMNDDETIHDFHMSIINIANTFCALGETMSEEKLVKKILISLLKKYGMKVTTIEEARNLSNMKVDELIGLIR